MAGQVARIEVSGMPEVLAAMRREFARLVEQAAVGEEPAVARRLREVAAAFECGSETVDGQ